MGDFEVFAADMADPVTRAHLSGPLDRRMAWRIFSAATGSWMLNGAGWWAVELRATGEFLGTVGVFFRDTDTELEIGWSMVRRFWGQGFASEAAGAALHFAFETRQAPRVVAHIDAPNLASIRVSQRLGMRHEADVDFYGTVVGRYVIERP
jgi:RimJ/RimL family protein N-acetyltransferase